MSDKVALILEHSPILVTTSWMVGRSIGHQEEVHHAGRYAGAVKSRLWGTPGRETLLSPLPAAHSRQNSSSDTYSSTYLWKRMKPLMMKPAICSVSLFMKLHLVMSNMASFSVWFLLLRLQNSQLRTGHVFLEQNIFDSEYIKYLLHPITN